ncbi:hypothetical protein OCA23_27140 [Bacillus cereus]|nr:hypothetical protein [Bacillus cereus]
MEEIFRMAVIRPAQKLKQKFTVSLNQASDFQLELSKVSIDYPNPLSSIRDIAKSYVASELYIDDIKKIHFYSPLMQLRNKLESLRYLNMDTINKEIFDQCSCIWKEVVGSKEWDKDIMCLRDSILTIKLLSDQHTKPLDELVKMLRLMNLIELITDESPILLEENAVSKTLEATILMPDWYQNIPEFRQQNKENLEAINNQSNEKLNELINKENKISKAYTELKELLPNMFTNNIEIISKKHEDIPNDDESNLFKTGESKQTKIYKTLKPEAVDLLSDSTKEVIEHFNIEIKSLPANIVLKQLQKHWKNISIQLDDFMKKEQMSLNVIDSNPNSNLSNILMNDIPMTHSHIKPVGIADLLVVKQKLVGYEAGDIAHIENILQGESKSREHRRKQVSDQFLLEEHESSREEDQDLQTTQRFETSREISELLKEQTKLEAGLKVTAKYGVSLEVEANAKYAVDKAHEISKKESTHFSKEIVDKTVKKFSEKVREQRSNRVIEEVEETNKHAFENSNGDKNIIGIYQWLNKVYEAQVFNYGLRTMYEVMIPEPAAFFIDASKYKSNDVSNIKKPADFTISPTSINQYNFQKYIALYGAEGVKVPPESTIVIAKTFKVDPVKTIEDSQFTEILDLPIPQGYEATEVFINCHYYYWEPIEDATFKIQVSDVEVDLITEGEAFSSYEDTFGYDLRGSIPISIFAGNVQAYTVSIEVHCDVTEMAMEQWKIDVFTTLRQAYEKRLGEYEEKLAKLLEKRRGIQGFNPIYNEKLIKDELKKGAISIITQQHYDFLNAVTHNDKFPQIDLNVVENQGNYIRFFEQAFEWENITFLFYPYFWANKTTWYERFDFEDTDPLFSNFVKAGAVRVVIPARPGFEAAIDHFMKTGEIWNGAELPDITDPLYLPIVEEIKGQMGAPTDEKPWGKTWKVIIPTNLVSLRQSDTLPAWEKNKYGEWVPVKDN